MGLFCKSEPLFIRLASSGLVFLSIAPSGLGMDSLSGHEAPIRAEGNIDIGLPSTSIGTGVESIGPIRAKAFGLRVKPRFFRLFNQGVLL
jgi:hypothetical protein